ncbi:hypothetical protein A7X67_07720 [Clostridium sp. W14A]|nr:hypothetical protein A7X67_07720 [Clostridium sp. W14A]
MVVSSGISLIAMTMMLFVSLLFVAEHVLFGLAAYHDAQSQGNPDAVIWGLAVGFLGIIPGIIYLCVRGSGRRLVRCANCGYPHDATDFCCPKCGEKNPAAAEANPYAQVLASRARKEMIGGIAVIAAGILLMILVMLFFGVFMMRYRVIF